MQTSPSRLSQVRNRDLHQYFTPEWAAAAILDEFFPDLGRDDVILEPSCGRGAFLKACPPTLEAVGVEIDPELAIEAAEDTGRRVICGDFRTVPLDVRPTIVLGNPPYRQQLFAQFLQRAKELLPPEGRCGFLLSSHMLQTPTTVLRWAEEWGLEQHIVPRTLFPRSVRPLVFVMFRKDRVRLMRGFSLYQHAADVQSMPKKVRVALVHGRPGVSCWQAVVTAALERLGGRASLQEIYAAVAPHRPTDNPWWEAKVRQVLQQCHKSIARGVWGLAG